MQSKNNTMSPKEVAGVIRAVVKSKHLTFKACAEMLGYSEQCFNYHLQGKKYLCRKTAYQLQELLGISAVFLMTGEGEALLRENADSSDTVHEEPRKMTPKEVADTVRLEIRKRGITLAYCAGLLHCTRQSLNSQLGGEKYFSFKMANVYQTMFGFNAEFLQTGEGEVFTAGADALLRPSPETAGKDSPIFRLCRPTPSEAKMEELEVKVIRLEGVISRLSSALNLILKEYPEAEDLLGNATEKAARD